MRHFKRTKSDKRRGAALVETAIVLPVFFLVVLGIIEFGRAFMIMQLVNTAARDATRSAIMDGTNNTEVTDIAKTLVSNTVTIPKDKVTVNISVTEHTGNPNANDEIASSHKRDTIKIDVSVDYADTSFLTPRFLASAVIRGTSAMRHE